MLLNIESEKQMQAFGLALGSALKAADVIALTGDLGAGKTTLSKAIAKGMGIHESITSPTFTIVNEYEPEDNLGLFHFDVYRISDASELDDIGFEEYLQYRAPGKVGHHPGYGVIIEWANLIEDLMPEETLWLSITLGTEHPEQRTIQFSGGQGHGPSAYWTQVLSPILAEVEAIKSYE